MVIDSLNVVSKVEVGVDAAAVVLVVLVVLALVVDLVLDVYGLWVVAVVVVTEDVVRDHH